MGNTDQVDVVVQAHGGSMWDDIDRLTSNCQSSSSSSHSHHNGKIQRPMGPAYTFILPDLFQFADGFRQFLERDIIEMPTLRRLEQSGHLNWWCVHHAQRLYPLVTTGDGNCLLHAASLGTWGVHDRELHLRTMLYNVLKNGSRRHAFWRRWRWSESKSNLQSELVLSEDEWAKEWNDVLQMSAPTPRTSQVADGGDGPTKSHSNEQIYESLETIHVFALAHILKRPIVVASDTVLRNANGEELSPIPFGGIYLPLECHPSQCHRSPLVLCYDSSHFSALVSMRSPSSPYLAAVPIMDKNRNVLPVHFAVDPGADFSWWKDIEDERISAAIDKDFTEDYRLELIARYMDIVKMDLRRGSIRKTLPFASSQEAFPVPTKLMTLASSGGGRTAEDGLYDKAAGSGRIMREIRQHLRRLGRKSKKEKPSPRRYSVAELRQSNCILTALLHNFAHQYTDSMVDNYISVARRRFEESRTPSTTFTPKNRMSRSFSSSSVLLTCLNTHCDKTASPSTNFLCPRCFEDQKAEMTSIGAAAGPSNPCTSNSAEPTPPVRGLYAHYREQSRAAEANGLSKKSLTMPAISTAAHTNIPMTTELITYFDSEPPEFEDDDEMYMHEPPPPPKVPPRMSSHVPIATRNAVVLNHFDNNNSGEKCANGGAKPIPSPRKALANGTTPAVVNGGALLNHHQQRAAVARFPVNRTNIHITPGTAHCHTGDGVSPNISATKVTYHYATTRS